MGMQGVKSTTGNVTSDNDGTADYQVVHSKHQFRIWALRI